MPSAKRREHESLPADIRDMLTRSWLERATAHLAGVEVVEFDSEWWDGHAHTPCLVVRGGRKHRLLRVVETAGEAVVVPFDRRAAEDRLAARRRPARAELGIPAQRRTADAVFDATGDVVRCATATCGALLAVGYAGACPLCGAEPPRVEKSTVTGARTAGSSTSK